MMTRNKAVTPREARISRINQSPVVREEVEELDEERNESSPDLKSMRPRTYAQHDGGRGARVLAH